ncbi:MAG TPA: glycosyltransferase [Polyangia bacterium]|jgi:glycosyltransferase involved in cell wall biosynthesis
MVVAHVLSSLQIGGGEKMALELAAGQLGEGNDVMVVSLAPPPDGPLADAFRARGIDVQRVAKRPGFDVTMPLRLSALFRRRRVGVVHTHNRQPLIYGAAAGKLAGAKVVHTRHGPGRGTPRERLLRRGAGYLVDAYVAVSPELAALARELGDCDDGKLKVIENGIDLGTFGGAAGERDAVRAELGIPRDAWVVGSVGRLAREKDYPLLVRAAAPLLGPEGRLVLVGDGAEAAAIRAEIDARGVAAFASLAGVRHDVARCLAAMDAFALSSRLEGLPLCALEAMAAGLPVVATRVGGLPGLIEDGATGLLVPPGDEQAMGRALASLRADPARARAIGERGRAHVRRLYAKDAMVRRYLDLYVSVGARA